MAKSIFIYDYETFGIDPKRDRVSQFAGIRTDEDFNIIEDPVNIYCKPANDFYPSPDACLITKISPFTALEKGLPEKEFFEQVEDQLGRAGTCSMGYNTVQFDDEFTRYGFYRNFINPYAREWQNGNSRWDLMNVLRLIHAIQPDAFNVPYDEEGKPSFRLEKLTEANGIEHENAHDALADVIGTIEMAKIAKKNAPELFETLYQQRQKSGIQKLIDSGKPFLEASPFFGHEKQYVDMIFPVGRSNANKNEFYCVKINHDNVNEILERTPQEINDIVYNKDNEKKLPIHKVQINKCPIVVPSSYLNKEIAQRLGLDGQLCRENLSIIKSRGAKAFSDQIETAMNLKPLEPFTDADMMLYSGFFSKNDEAEIKTLREKDISELANHKLPNNVDNRLPDLLFRHIGRNNPDAFSDEERIKWEEYRLERLNNPEFNASVTKDSFYSRIEELKNNDEFEHDQKSALLDDLCQYASMIEQSEKPTQKNAQRKRQKP